jgi:hypothetical protein
MAIRGYFNPNSNSQKLITNYNKFFEAMNFAGDDSKITVNIENSEPIEFDKHIKITNGFTRRFEANGKVHFVDIRESDRRRVNTTTYGLYKNMNDQKESRVYQVINIAK